jgi:ornithine cyclodeaminase/alanine dehydrogenase-like protein (mu-crystallin family)
MTLLLTRADLASLLTPEDCLAAVEEAFRASIAAKSIGFPASNGTFHIKAALSDVFAAKINANFPGNPRLHALPTIQGVIVVMDVERGTVLAILDSALITTLRTAAATALAAKHLARGDATALTVIGCGIHGRASVDALRLVRPIRNIFAYDVDEACAARFARDTNGVVVTSLEEAIGKSDIVVTCTPSRTAILDAHHLRPGLFIAAVGADNPEKQELTPALLARTKIVPDILEQAATMGDLHHAIASGTLRREDIHGELADVLGGRVAGRTNDEEIFVFDSTGTALQDVAVASIAVRRATERHAGISVHFAQATPPPAATAGA